MVAQIEDRLNLARELLQAARDEFAKAGEAKGGEAVAGMRNACRKGWLAAMEATNRYFLMRGILESDLPKEGRQGHRLASRYMDRDTRAAYLEMSFVFYELGSVNSIVEFEDMPFHLSELEAYITGIEADVRSGSDG